MEQRKEYKAPYYSVLILASFVTAYFVLNWLLMIRDNDTSDAVSIIVSGVIYISILSGETAAYWYMRTWKLHKLLVWLHIVSLYIRLLVLPTIHVVIFLNEEENLTTELDRKIAALLPTLYWVVPVIAHIPFIIAIIEGYRNKGKSDHAIHMQPTS